MEYRGCGMLKKDHEIGVEVSGGLKEARLTFAEILISRLRNVTETIDFPITTHL